MIKSNQCGQVSSNTNTLIFAKSFKDMVTVIVSSFVFLLWWYSEPPVQWNDLALTFNNSFIDLLNQYNIKHKIKHREQRLVCLGNYRLFSSSGDFFFLTRLQSMRFSQEVWEAAGWYASYIKFHPLLMQFHPIPVCYTEYCLQERDGITGDTTVNCRGSWLSVHHSSRLYIIKLLHSQLVVL